MTAESEGMATGTMLQKVKVKEETKDRRGMATGVAEKNFPRKSSSPTTPTTPTAAVSVQVNDDPVVPVVDLDLKTKANAGTVIKERIDREDTQFDVVRRSSPGRSLRTADAGCSSHASSDGSESPTPSQNNSRHETEDERGARNEEKDEPSVAGINGVFAAHGELKSVLGTVVKFATGISQDTGDTVLTLVLTLLSGGMTADEFHTALQEATNYTLKGFVLPHLKQQLPSLQRDLSNAARASNQSCSQFLRANESAVLEAVGLVSAAEPIELFGEHAGNTAGNQCTARYAGTRSNSNPAGGAVQQANNSTGGLHHYSSGTSHATKRRASDTPYYENGTVLADDVPVYGKRLTNPWNHHRRHQRPPSQSPQQQTSTDGSSPYCWYHPLHSASGSIQGHGHSRHGHVHGSLTGNSPSMSQINSFGSHHTVQQPQQINHVQSQNGTLDDEWKNIHMMLNCILGMVEKTKKALAILQSRGCFGQPSQTTSNASTQNGGNNNPSSTNGSQVELSTGDREGSLKRLSGEIVAQTIRAIEDKVAEVKRKDEEAVKRTVVAEVQRAVRVAVAESRATERLRIHRLLDVSLSQRNHGPPRHGPYLRIHGNPTTVDGNARTVTAPTTVSNSAPSTSEDEKDSSSHLHAVSGSSCWNCGRPALESCGGCRIARYCGSFCQHRDWETGGHHATCNNPAPREPRRSVSRSPPRVSSGALSATVNDTSATPSIQGNVAPKGK